MTKAGQIALITGLGLATTGLVLMITIPAVKKGKIRQRLDDAFGNPYESGAIGGISQLQASSAFDPNRHLVTNKATISRLDALDRAEKVWSNYGSWYSSDNESAMVNAFDGLGHYDDLSKIAYYFEKEYDNDLFTILEDALKEDKQQTQLLMGKINNLPNN